jgi:hypothetical protein
VLTSFVSKNLSDKAAFCSIIALHSLGGPPSGIGRKGVVGARVAQTDERKMTRLIVLQKGGSAKQVNILGTPFVLGRADTCELVLDNQLVSRSHAVIEFSAEGTSIRDLQSHNGTFVNGKRIESVMLNNGDEIRIGTFQIRFLSRSSPIPDAEALRLVTVPGRLADIDLLRLGSK